MRLRLLVEGAKRIADFCDIEAAHYDEAAKLSPDPSKLILSHHNFDETPPNLDDVYERVCSLPAAAHKIVTRAKTINDSLAILKLLNRAREEKRNLIALAMGEPGQITRIIGHAFGGFLTYGSIAAGAESAPGQLTCDELMKLYRVHALSQDSMVAGIIGLPVSHSASPAMHNAAFRALKLDAVYLPLEVDDPASFFARFVRPDSRELDWNLRGLSVTFPHKAAVMPLLDSIDPTAKQIGAVNTVVIEAGRLTGFNTDAIGAMQPLAAACVLEARHCAVVGAGGAARAVIYGLVNRGARVTIFARDAAKARPLAEQFNVSLLPIESLESSDAEIIINTTPVGMRGHSEGSSPVAQAALRHCKVAYDLVYNPIETRFLTEARDEGCLTISGLDMLIAQAALQFELWTGLKPPVDVMRAAALEKVTRQTSRL